MRDDDLSFPAMQTSLPNNDLASVLEAMKNFLDSIVKFTVNERDRNS
jgi:hypothetical protein